MRWNNSNKEIAYSLGLILIPVVLLFTAIFLTKPKKEMTPIDADLVTTEKQNVFDLISIQGRAAIVKDLNSGEILYAKNPNLPLPLASITKVLTALTTELAAVNDIFYISLNDLSTEGDSFLYPGERFYKKDLIDLTLITSSNDGASALAANTFSVDKKKFISEMNRIASQIGMNDSFFYNETGLDNNNTTAGAHGTASDIAVLFEYVLNNFPDLLESTKEDFIRIRSITGFVHNATNTNDMVGELPNLIASKTGFTNIAGGNLAVVVDPGLNRPISIVVLGSTEQGRFNDVKLLAKKVVEYLNNY